MARGWWLWILQTLGLEFSKAGSEEFLTLSLHVFLGPSRGRSLLWFP